MLFRGFGRVIVWELTIFTPAFSICERAVGGPSSLIGAVSAAGENPSALSGACILPAEASVLPADTRWTYPRQTILRSERVNRFGDGTSAATTRNPLSAAVAENVIVTSNAR